MPFPPFDDHSQFSQEPESHGKEQQLWMKPPGIEKRAEILVITGKDRPGLLAKTAASCALAAFVKYDTFLAPSNSVAEVFGPLTKIDLFIKQEIFFIQKTAMVKDISTNEHRCAIDIIEIGGSSVVGYLLY
jgi:hypothetical protein